jgi:hypothetical protein
VVNPEYNRTDYKLKKVREKINRRLAKLYLLEHESINSQLEDTAKSNIKQVNLEKELEELRDIEQVLLGARAGLSYKIKIKDMPEEQRYNRLHIESKHFQNIIKMICYRAETSFANLLAPHYSKSSNEKRMLTKSIIKSNIDLIPCYKTNTLNINLYSLSTPRDNAAVKEMCQILNEQNVHYPGTNLRLRYNMAT